MIEIDHTDRYRAWCAPCGRFASVCCSADPRCLEKARANAPPPNRHERRCCSDDRGRNRARLDAPMTPIRETIARAISPYYWAAAGTARDTRAKKVHRDRSLFAADRVLRALDEAGCVVVPKEASEAMVEAHMGECAGDADEAGPDRIRGAYRAMISASVVE